MRRKREDRGPDQKGIRRPKATPWPDGFEKLFPDTDHFEQFKEEWRLIEKRKGVKLADIPDILTRVSFRAKVEQEFHLALTRMRDSRADLFEQDQRIRKLLKDLRGELKRLHSQNDQFLGDQLDAIRRLHASRVWLEDEDSPITPYEPLTHYLAPIVKLYFEFESYVVTFLDELGATLRRQRGHQRQPSINPAMKSLRKAGLTKVEADSPLRTMGLKGSEAAKAARQTRPHR